MDKNSRLNADLVGSASPVKDFANSASQLFNGGVVNNIAAPQDWVAVGAPVLKYLPIVGIGRNDTTALNKHAGTPLIDLLNQHTLAYIKDERTLKFLYPTNTGNRKIDQNNFEKRQEIRKLHQNLWGQFDPRKETFILQPHRKGK